MYCPGCHKKLDTSLTSCDRCGWQIALGQCIPRAEHDRIADYWVTVDLPESMAGEHRDVFIREFTSHHCPRPNQFAMEYDTARLQPDYFPGGQLCLITEDGIQA